MEKNKYNKINIVMFISFLTNLLLSLLKIVSSIVFNSTSLMADGIHSFSDLITDIIAIIGNNFAHKPPDDKHPFGHGKFEYIASLIIGFSIILLGIILIKESIIAKINIPNYTVITVIIITIFIKIVLYKYLLKKGFKYGNSILIASGKESMTDVLSSILVLISVITMQFSNKYKFLMYSDKLTSIIISILIIKVGFNVVQENLSMAIGECVTDKMYLKDIREILLKKEDVVFMNDLIILKYGPYLILDCEICMPSDLLLKDVSRTISKIKSEIKKYDSKINYININVSTNDDKNNKFDNNKNK